MKLRSALVFLLAAALVVLGGMLPGLVGRRQDAENENRVEFAPINEVELEFAEADMTIREKLAITGRTVSVVEIPEQLATLTRDKAWQIVADTLERYSQAGLTPGIGSITDPWVTVMLQPVLMYGNSGEQCNVFWQADIFGGEAVWTCSILLDDQTGTVCRIGFTDFVEEGTLYPDMQEALYTLCDLYLTGLGEEFFDYDPRALADSHTGPADGSYMASELQWADADSGEYRMVLYLRNNGFNVYLYYNY